MPTINVNFDCDCEQVVKDVLDQVKERCATGYCVESYTISRDNGMCTVTMTFKECA